VLKRLVQGDSGCNSVELATMAGDISQTGVESTPVVVRDPERFQTLMTVIMTAVVVLGVSVLAVAMNLT
jgi:hypothetical protein